MSIKRRVQFDFTEEALQEMEALQRLTGLPTKAELLRHALRLLQWAVEETVNNKAVLLVEKHGKQREVLLPFWQRSSTEQLDTLVAPALAQKADTNAPTTPVVTPTRRGPKVPSQQARSGQSIVRR